MTSATLFPPGQTIRSGAETDPRSLNALQDCPSTTSGRSSLRRHAGFWPDAFRQQISTLAGRGRVDVETIGPEIQYETNRLDFKIVVCHGIPA